jgi:hypothetical protein
VFARQEIWVFADIRLSRMENDFSHSYFTIDPMGDNAICLFSIFPKIGSWFTLQMVIKYKPF